MGSDRTGQHGSIEQRDLGTLRPEQGLDAIRRRRGQVSREAEGDERIVPQGSEEVRGVATGCVGCDALRRASAQHHGRAVGLHLHQAYDRSSTRRFPAVAQLLLHHHRRRRSAGRRW